MSDFRIQRIPRGLQNLLGMFGPNTPESLGDEICGTLELLQMYGLSQLQTLTTSNAAVAVGGAVQLVIGPAGPSVGWSVLFNAEARVGKAVAMTALAAGVTINRGGLAPTSSHVAYGEPVRFVGTGTFVVPFVPAYPILLPPGSSILATVEELVGVANAPVTVQADLGIFA